jgi:SAM-dependent methyltransferase
MAQSSETEACPRCGAPSKQIFVVPDRNRAVSDGSFPYRRCVACSVVWLADPPADLGAHYPSDYHDFLGPEEMAQAAALEADRIAMLTPSVSGGRLVEIGPSQGVFAWAAKDAGFDVTGLEMDARCCEHLRTVVGVEAINTADPAGALAELPPSRAIVMFHVIEHVPDPWDVLRAIAENLEPGGVLLLATPNPDSLQFKLFGPRWVHLDAPRHVTLIPLAALEDEGRELGLSRAVATSVDRVGLECNRLGWERSLISAPALRPEPRLAYTLGRVLTPLASPLEHRGLRGSTYTAVLRKSSAVERAVAEPVGGSAQSPAG